MPEGPQPRIVRSFDNAKIQPSGAVLETLVVRFMFGELGPFELEVPRTTSQSELERLIDERLAPFGWRRY